MSEFRVASRYAKSIFGLAVELGKEDRIFEDMLLIKHVCAENRNLILMLRNPIIKDSAKAKILNRIFEKYVDELTIHFFALMCRKNRAEVIPDTSVVFVDLYDEYKGILRAQVITAITLSAELKKNFEGLVAKATGKTVELETSVDESLIGGFVVKIEDTQLDNSLKAKLKELERELKS